MYFLKIKINRSTYTLENANKETLKTIFTKIIKIKKATPDLLSSNAFEIKNGFNKELQQIVRDAKAR